ncbi:MerR family transcriptional regulator [Shimia ponticola]|uniref:MerR family transcriptional regulator n=1 Tax=Shimia ponticola TaxID=2582893 RepID=UPI0011BDF3D6|nr:MerR family transcriptional regulator [Shimia ponticola]
MAKSREAFRTISEVADALGTQPHVLRFWESKFSQIKPVKRAGGRRYYRPADMALLGGIKQLLHEDGLTIKGVQKILRERGVKYVAALAEGAPMEVDAETIKPDENVVPLRKSTNDKGKVKTPKPETEIDEAEIVADAKDDQLGLFDSDPETPKDEPVAAQQPPEDASDVAQSDANILLEIKELSTKAAALDDIEIPPLQTIADRLSALRDRMASDARG